MTDTVRLIRKVTLIGVWINAALVALKLFFGYRGQSDALVADGYHSLSDFVTDVIVIVFVAASYKKADSGHPYGHGKFETVATVLIGVILLAVGVFIGFEGVRTLSGFYGGEELPRPDKSTLFIAVASILMKEFCYRYTMRYGLRLNSPSLQANAWHHRSDAISSVATLAGVSCALFFGEQWRVADPIASIIIAFMIMYSAVRIFMPAVDELLEKGVPADTLSHMRDSIGSVAGVRNVHNLRARRNGHYLIVDVNIHVDGDITVMEGHAIASEAERALHDKFGDDMIIYVHVEPE